MVGNCQARGVARALEVLAADGPVAYLPTTRLGRDYGTVEALAGALEAYDHVFTQYFPPGFLRDGGSDDLGRMVGGRAALFPTIVFSAFHPDMVYVGDLASLAEVRLVHSPMGHYHSALALFAYLEGLDERRTVALFREEVFAALGYLDGWAAAADALLRSAEGVAFDLGPDLLRWTRRGQFMHVFNHPRLFVLADIARALAARAGLPAREVPVEDYIGDELVRDVIWPVYGPVAERYGVPGSYVFKVRQRGAGPPAFYDLPGFVAASFALYRRRDPAELACARVAAWRADPAARALLAA